MGEPKDSTILLPMPETLDEDVMDQAVARATAHLKTRSMRADLLRIAGALAIHESAADLPHVLETIKDLQADAAEAYQDGLDDGRAEGFASGCIVGAAIVAWGDAIRKTYPCTVNGHAWEWGVTIDADVCGECGAVEPYPSTEAVERHLRWLETGEGEDPLNRT